MHSRKVGGMKYFVKDLKTLWSEHAFAIYLHIIEACHL